MRGIGEMRVCVKRSGVCERRRGRGVSDLLN